MSNWYNELDSNLSYLWETLLEDSDYEEIANALERLASDFRKGIEE